jgi:outer membrane protein TolC
MCSNNAAHRNLFGFGRKQGAVLIVIALGGCAWITPRIAPDPALKIPASWSENAQALAHDIRVPGMQDKAIWWTRFNDPLLSELVQQSLSANTNVLGAQAALLQARALRDVAAAGLLPALGVSGSAQRNTSRTAGSGNHFQAGFDASWEPDIFGARKSAVDTADALARASAASLGDVQVSITAEVALDYILLRGAQWQSAIAAANLANQRETLQITQWREQAGLVTTLETEQARAAAEQTRAQLPAMQTRIEQTSHALAVLTGQVPRALMATLHAGSKPIPDDVPAVNAAVNAAVGPSVVTENVAGVPVAPDALAMSMPANTLRQRADVRAAEQQVRAALGRVAQAEAARAPNFTISGSLGLSALSAGSLTSGASVVSALLASVAMPLFDGGGRRAQVRAEEAALEQAALTYRATLLTALKDVEDALIALRSDRDRLLHLQHAAQSAGSAALLARQRYSSGLVDFQVVLETQRTQFSTQDSVASASADLSADHVRLYKALGGGWHPDDNPLRTSL